MNRLTARIGATLNELFISYGLFAPCACLSLSADDIQVLRDVMENVEVSEAKRPRH